MHQLILSGIECYAHHGCLSQETVIGGRYRVDITFYADLSIAANSDNLTQTIDYVEVNEMVKTQMAIPSKLIEHVGSRIAQKMKERFTICSKIKVALTKYNPPVKGFISEATFVIEI